MGFQPLFVTTQTNKRQYLLPQGFLVCYSVKLHKRFLNFLNSKKNKKVSRLMKRTQVTAS